MAQARVIQVQFQLFQQLHQPAEAVEVENLLVRPQTDQEHPVVLEEVEVRMDPQLE